MELLEFAKTASGFGSLGFFVLLFLWGLDKGYISLGKFKFNGNGEKNGKTTPTDSRLKADETPIWAQQLMTHFNHETTEKLDKLVEGITALTKGIEIVHLKHSEWDKYGVPARCIKEE